ncbi:MAG: peptide-binding protein [Gammaproteobacteria bacterium]|nr:peptide-binding protein [Gammaproteobacteria bacterium]
MASSQRKPKKLATARPTTINFQAPKLTTQTHKIDAITANGYLQQAMQLLGNHQAAEAYRLANLCVLGVDRQQESIRTNAKWIGAVALMQLGRATEALVLLKEIEKVIPNDVANLGNIGAALLQTQQYLDAAKYFQKVLSLQPQHADAYHGLGHAYYYQGLCDDAYRAYAKAFEIDPRSFKALEGMMFMQYYQYPLDMDAHFENVKKCAQFFSDMIKITTRHDHSFEPDKTLRIGFVSGDLNTHPVAFFLESTLRQIKSGLVSTYPLTLIAYHNSHKQDEYSQRLKPLFDVWHQVDVLNDEQLVQQIQDDQIDILIDLSGHTHGNRLSVFARKPAPVQLSWLGYWGSTGLSSIDYVLADPISIPADEEKWFVEKIWKLPHLRYCFSISSDAQEISPLPCLELGYVTFASYQTLPKINDGVMLCWLKILSACPTARLRIQSKDFSKPDVKARFTQRLNALGIDILRIDLVGEMSRADYLASYADVDIVLDTFPYTGGTTTVEALWMGVPTLTLATVGMLGRQGEAIMMNAELSDWVVHHEDEYVQEAINWGNAHTSKLRELAELRKTMREKVRRSPVFNDEQFAQDFVNALFAIWQKKCEEVIVISIT